MFFGRRNSLSWKSKIDHMMTRNRSKALQYGFSVSEGHIGYFKSIRLECRPVRSHSGNPPTMTSLTLLRTFQPLSIVNPYLNLSNLHIKSSIFHYSAFILRYDLNLAFKHNR